uniref:Uncharacterized protein n=1 Tax=Desulfobacca acetoxidans TaxID=60893 RepID=A0A7C5AKW3_9BACT
MRHFRNLRWWKPTPAKEEETWRILELIDQVARGKTPELGDKTKCQKERDMEELNIEIPEEILREMQEDEEAEREEERAAWAAEKEGRILYLEALKIVKERPDLDPGGDMPEWGILEPKKFFIWALLSIMFVANGEQDLRVRVKDDLKPFVDWYSRASEFEKSEAWNLFKE